MDALLVRIAERITSGADPLLSHSEALELARLPREKGNLKRLTKLEIS